MSKSYKNYRKSAHSNKKFITQPKFVDFIIDTVPNWENTYLEYKYLPSHITQKEYILLSH